MNQIYSRNLTILFLLILLVAAIACSDGENGNPVLPEPEPVNVEISDISIADLGNEGSSADIMVGFTAKGELDKVLEMRVVLAKSSSSIKVDDILSIDSFMKLNVEDSAQVQLASNLNDTDNDPIKNGREYKAYVAAITNSNNTLSLESNPLTLKDEILVTTLQVSGLLNGSEDISIDGDNNLYINGGGTNKTTLFKVTPSGISTALSTELNSPVGNTIDVAGNVYATNFESTSINKISPSGETTVLVSDSRLTGGGGITIDNNGVLYNTFFSTKNIFKIENGVVSVFTSSNLLNGPVGMTYDKVHDKIYVANFGNGRIFHVASDGTFTEIGRVPANIGHIAYANDHFYVTGWNQHKVWEINLNGEITAVIGNGNNRSVDGNDATASFANPNGVEVTPDGKYLYVSQGDGKTRKIVL